MSKPTMLDYVHETPSVLRRQMSGSYHLELTDEFCKHPYRIFRIVACGSSKNAAQIARPYLRCALNCEVLITEPYTFTAHEHDLPKDELCVVVSQSGYSTNALAALDAVKAAGRTAIGITGDPQSDFRNAADILIDYGVEEERVGYVTKGVASLAWFFCLFGLEVATKSGRFTNEKACAELRDFEAIISRFEQVARATPSVLAGRYKELSSMEVAFMCGAGANYGVAREGALKYAETLQFPAQALELEEYLHGPNLQLAPNYSVFVNAVGTPDWRRAEQIAAATRLVTDHVFILTDNPRMEQADIVIDHLAANENRSGSMSCTFAEKFLTPLALLPFYQITAYQLTEDKHLWHKHPLVASFDCTLSGKSENYVDKEVI